MTAVRQADRFSRRRTSEEADTRYTREPYWPPGDPRRADLDRLRLVMPLSTAIAHIAWAHRHRALEARRAGAKFRIIGEAYGLNVETMRQWVARAEREQKYAAVSRAPILRYFLEDPRMRP